MKESGHYEDGQKEGNWQEFHRNGQVASKVTYRRGCYVGRGERYHENGRLAERGNYADRPDCVGPEVLRHPWYPREGVWEYFDEDAKVCAIFVKQKTSLPDTPGPSCCSGNAKPTNEVEARSPTCSFNHDTADHKTCAEAQWLTKTKTAEADVSSSSLRCNCCNESN